VWQSHDRCGAHLGGPQASGHEQVERGELDAAGRAGDDVTGARVVRHGSVDGDHATGEVRDQALRGTEQRRQIGVLRFEVPPVPGGQFASFVGQSGVHHTLGQGGDDHPPQEHLDQDGTDEQQQPVGRRPDLLAHDRGRDRRDPEHDDPRRHQGSVIGRAPAPEPDGGQQRDAHDEPAERQGRADCHAELHEQRGHADGGGQPEQGEQARRESRVIHVRPPRKAMRGMLA
jgi:hypothetical protein